MFSKLFKYAVFILFTYLVLIVGYRLDKAMWVECSHWYGRLAVVIAIVTIEIGYGAVVECLWKEL